MGTRNSTLTATFYDRSSAEEWDRFVLKSANGSVLHSRRFLDYHGDRFNEISIIFRDERDNSVTGILPAVAALDGKPIAVSHAGSSFGGMIVAKSDPRLTAELFLAASERLLEAGFSALSYLSFPTQFHRTPADSDQLFLDLAGRAVEHHLWSVIPLTQPLTIQARYISAARAALKAGRQVHVGATDEDFREFYQLLSANLLERYGRRPVHSFSEVMALRERLGSDSHLYVLRTSDGDPLAATWIWVYRPGVWHSQYTCATSLGRRYYDISLLFVHCVEAAKNTNAQIYSLGRNSLDDGWRVNEGLLRFKRKFGCGLCSQRRYETQLVDLQRVCEEWLLQN